MKVILPSLGHFLFYFLIQLHGPLQLFMLFAFVVLRISPRALLNKSSKELHLQGLLTVAQAGRWVMIFQPSPHWADKHVSLLQTLSNGTYIFILVKGNTDYNYPNSHQWVPSFPPPILTPPFFFFPVLGIELGAMCTVGTDSGTPK